MFNREMTSRRTIEKYYKPSGTSEKNIYYLISYDRKEDAKALGAKWDANLKLWYLKSTSKNNIELSSKFPLIYWNDCDHCDGSGNFCGDKCWGCKLTDEDPDVIHLPCFVRKL